MDGFQLPHSYISFEEAVHFLQLSSQIFLVLILSTFEGWKAESTLEPPSGATHPILKMRQLDWESIALTTRPLPHKWRYFEIQIHFCLPRLNLVRKKTLSVTPCSCARSIHYTSSILVKVIDLIQLFFHMLTLKALV